MKAHFLKKFRKNYKKRILPDTSLDKQFSERFQIFLKNSRNELLHDHMLQGKLKGCRAFSITGDIRAIYYIQNDTVYFLDIGTHNQVY